VAGYENAVEESHVAVAACVASGIADVGLGAEAAALEFGLHFLPIVAEDYFLACLKPNLEHPAVLRLRELLAADAWACVLESLPGYSSARAPGAVLSLTTELPWWRFATPRGRTPAGVAERRAAPLVQTMP
jgi:putative molybdopterin biosynthesis protein